MMSIDDKTLMAFVDGELDSERAEQLRKRLSSDSTLRERASIFSDTADLLDEAFEPTLREPMPEAIRESLESPTSVATERPSPAPILARRQFSWMSPRSLALAASLLLMVGVTGGFIASRVISNGAQPSAHSIAVLDGSVGWQRGFDATPSGQAFTVAATPGRSEEEIVPLATFLDHQDRYCRAYQRSAIARPGAVRVRGIACRAAEGSWVTRIIVADSITGTATAQPSDQGGAYRPAAGESNDAFDRVLEAHMTTSPLSADRETQLIERAWR